MALDQQDLFLSLRVGEQQKFSKDSPNVLLPAQCWRLAHTRPLSVQASLPSPFLWYTMHSLPFFASRLGDSLPGEEKCKQANCSRTYKFPSSADRRYVVDLEGFCFVFSWRND